MAADDDPHEQGSAARDMGSGVAVLRPEPQCRGRDPGTVAITHDVVADAALDQRQLFERIVRACGVDPDDVVEVRISEGGVEIDLVEFDSPDWPLRTFTCSSAGDAVGLECRAVLTGPASRRRTR